MALAFLKRLKNCLNSEWPSLNKRLQIRQRSEVFVIVAMCEFGLYQKHSSLRYYKNTHTKASAGGVYVMYQLQQSQIKAWLQQCVCGVQTV